MERDCLFIGKRYLFLEIPKEKKFLFKYFRGRSQRCFLKYFLFFGDYKYFIDHTGICLSLRWLKRLEKKYNDLLYLHSIFKSSVNLEMLSNLESGKIKKIKNILKMLSHSNI